MRKRYSGHTASNTTNPSGKPGKKNILGRKFMPGSSKAVRWMWGGFLGLGFLIAILLLLIYNGAIGYMPPIEELEDSD